MEPTVLLREITLFLRKDCGAESTFERLAVNDGKFVGRLRDGSRITTTTSDRVRSFMAGDPVDGGRTHGLLLTAHSAERRSALPPRGYLATTACQDSNFRFYNDRQNYLMSVNTRSEKRVVAERVAMELRAYGINTPYQKQRSTLSAYPVCGNPEHFAACADYPPIRIKGGPRLSKRYCRFLALDRRN